LPQVRLDCLQKLTKLLFNCSHVKLLGNDSAFKKDISFQYEKEYRFLIITIDNLDKIEPFYTISIDITALDLTVIAHPNMEEWKLENLKRLLHLADVKINIEKSATLLRNKTDR
jgi:hypothetical protein